ncbi:MAG: cytochrome B [Betaproteobacteria bacterium]|nr:MAG: cytochrome B [Betaproteobacteria bacterium]
MTKPSTHLISAPVWDVFVRVFHWSLVTLFAISAISGKVGGAWIKWHMISGYAILALVLFRIVWGFVGGEYARFSAFVSGPARAIRYGLGLVKGGAQHVISHNPLGGWMVIVLLLLLALQAGLGLVSDDEIATTGPLARYIALEAALKAMSWHRTLGDLLLILVGIHIAAVLFHVLVKKEGLIRAMFSGKKELPAELASEASAAKPASTTVGYVVISAAIVIVVIVVNWSSWFSK